MLTTPRFWYRRNLLAYCLSPFAAIFYLITLFRRWLYQVKIKKIHHFPVPIIIVGNITVGGTGKTPLVIWLAHFLKQQGFKPGIVSRGYGGKAPHYPYHVNSNSEPNIVGDEALLLARHTHCSIIIDPDRVAAVKKLLTDSDCNVVISDDGLQHYALGRTIEIAVIDGERRLGNGFCLPAGPLREPYSRLKKVDFVVINDALYQENSPLTRGETGGLKNLDSRVRGNDRQNTETNWYSMHLTPGKFHQLSNPTINHPADYFKNKTIHAVAGIGNPTRFFNLLRSMELTIIEHPFPDHHLFQAKDFGDQNLIVMTEKDAVKCTLFADERFWYLPVEAKFDAGFANKITLLLSKQAIELIIKTRKR